MQSPCQQAAHELTTAFTHIVCQPKFGASPFIAGLEDGTKERQ